METWGTITVSRRGREAVRSTLAAVAMAASGLGFGASVMAVEKAMPQIAKAIDAAAEAIGNGGKMIYIGAGTSGRLGIQDAAECPPTFGVEDWVVQGIIAGGRDRVFKAGENAEDFYENGVNDDGLG